MQGKFSLKYFLLGAGKEDFFKAWGTGVRLLATIIIILLLISGGLYVWNFLFPKAKINENKPTINVGQGGTSNYTVIQKSDSGWEAGAMVGAVTLGGQNGGFVGVEIKRRF